MLVLQPFYRVILLLAKACLTKVESVLILGEMELANCYILFLDLKVSDRAVFSISRTTYDVDP